MKATDPIDGARVEMPAAIDRLVHHSTILEISGPGKKLKGGEKRGVLTCRPQLQPRWLDSRLPGAAHGPRAQAP